MKETFDSLKKKCQQLLKKNRELMAQNEYLKLQCKTSLEFQLYEAIQRNDAKKVEDLLNIADVNIDQFNMFTYTPLMLAVSLENCRIAKILIKKGANVNTFDKESKENPLIVAIKRSEGLANWLLQLYSKKIDFTIQYQEDCNPILVALQAGYINLAETLYVKGAKLNKQAMQLLLPIKDQLPENSRLRFQCELLSSFRMHNSETVNQDPIPLSTFVENLISDDEKETSFAKRVRVQSPANFLTDGLGL